MEEMEKILREQLSNTDAQFKSEEITKFAADIMAAGTPAACAALAKSYQEQYGGWTPELHIILDALVLRVAFDYGYRDLCRIFIDADKMYA